MTPPPAPFAFVDAALDRADHLRDDLEALSTGWPQARILMLDAEGRALADAGNALFAPLGAEVGGGPGTALFLGLHGGQAWFAAQAETLELDAPNRIDLRSAAALWSPFEATLFAQARAMQHWRARHRHCGACGGEVAFVRAGWCGRCTQCQAEHYPRTDPAVIVAVTDGARLLLGRQAGWPRLRYSTLAGFVEPGESLEQAVAREVLEESGVRVRASRYLASQPWPFPGSLMLGFVADADPDPPRTGDELEDARWFDIDEVGRAIRGEARDGELLLSPSISISRWLVETWHASATQG
ncbi:MAG: NAD(+) diphosphatase [Luteimonas sp.]